MNPDSARSLASTYVSEQPHSIRNPQSAIRNVVAGGLMLAVVFTALALGTVEAWSVAVFELIAVILLFLWAAKAIVDKRLDINFPAAALPLGGFVLLGLIQSIAINRSGDRIASLSMDVEATRGASTVIFFLFACFLIASNFFRSGERLRTLANFLIIFGLILAVFALIQHFTWEGRLFWFRPMPAAGAGTGGPFVNRNHFAGYMEMLIPIPVALSLSRAIRGEARLLYAFAAAIMGIAEVASLSRGGLVSLVFGLIFLAVVSARQKRNDAQSTGKASIIFHPAVLIIAMAGAIIAGVVWVGADLDMVSRITNDPLTTGATMDRRAVWGDTLKMFSAHPILGVGLGAFETVYPIYGRGDGTYVIQFAHNDYIQVLADGGIVGGALALWFIIVVFRAFARGARRRDPLLGALALGGASGIVAILVHSLFDFNLQLPSNALLFLVLAAIVVTTGDGRPATDDGGPMTGDGRPETGDRGRETDDSRPMTGDGGRETGDR
jgi:O-antigen ligase